MIEWNIYKSYWWYCETRRS